ncbi:S-protein homolog 21 [Linum grandiflorum]
MRKLFISGGLIMIVMAAPGVSSKPKTVSVANQLSALLLMAHCQSADDDLGARLVSIGSKISWSFKDNVFHTTLFWCDIAVEDKRLHFDAYEYPGKARYLDTIEWVVDDSGVHTANGLLRYPW